MNSFCLRRKPPAPIFRERDTGFSKVHCRSKSWCSARICHCISASCKKGLGREPAQPPLSPGLAKATIACPLGFPLGLVKHMYILGPTISDSCPGLQVATTGRSCGGCTTCATLCQSQQTVQPHFMPLFNQHQSFSGHLVSGPSG